MRDAGYWILDGRGGIFIGIGEIGDGFGRYLGEKWVKVSRIGGFLGEFRINL